MSTDQANTPTTHQPFQAEVRQLLDIVINSLYTDREIFVRELVSNAADSLEKLRHLRLTESTVFESEKEPQIEITADAEAKTLTIDDYGIGMAHQKPRHHRPQRHQSLPPESRSRSPGRRQCHRPLRRRLLQRLHGR
jgi:hypothetical protein